jgi:DNA-directed RNA polymerase specialized sigma24 family protein
MGFMDRSIGDEHLSQITTQWTMLLRAHATPADAAAAAQHVLLDRYGGAVSRYLLGAVRDDDAAADLAQEFAVRFLRGDFRRADPGRGRFRDYLKTALSHLVTDHRRARAAAPRPLPLDAAVPADEADDDAVFLASWRAELLDRTWDALAAGHPTEHAVLLVRVSEPDLASAAVAEKAGARLGRPLTAAAARKALQRGHGRFAELLVREVTRSLGEPAPAEVEGELQELDLLRYCRSALAEHDAAGSDPAG